MVDSSSIDIERPAAVARSSSSDGSAHRTILGNFHVGQHPPVGFDQPVGRAKEMGGAQRLPEIQQHLPLGGQRAAQHLCTSLLGDIGPDLTQQPVGFGGVAGAQGQTRHAGQVKRVHTAVLLPANELNAATVVVQRLLVITEDFGEGCQIEEQPLEFGQDRNRFGQINGVLGAPPPFLEIAFDEGHRADDLLDLYERHGIVERARERFELFPQLQRLRK
jgi:hypothetical protein